MNTILYCRNGYATVSFHRDALRLPVTHETDWFVEFRLTGDAHLSVADSSRATIDHADGQGITLSWRVPDVSAVRSALGFACECQRLVVRRAPLLHAVCMQKTVALGVMSSWLRA